MRNVKGLATGIGSLPHTDVERALDLVFTCCPEAPFWPQLPKKNAREGMIAQFCEGLPCLRVTEKGVFFDVSNKERELEEFYAKIINGDSSAFAIAQASAQGLYAFRQRLRKEGKLAARFIKCHITGPFTFAAGIKDDGGKALLHDPVFLQVIINGLSMKALWQAQFLKEFGTEFIFFIDEPYLGCFGSGYTPINREDVVRGLSELCERISTLGNAHLGVHCCGNTDWAMFTEVPSLKIINFDATCYLERFVLYAENLKLFLSQEGVICWGIVPTQDENCLESADALLARLEGGVQALAKKGVPAQALEQNLLLSPSCGLGSLSETKAEKIFRLLAETSARVRKSP